MRTIAMPLLAASAVLMVCGAGAGEDLFFQQGSASVSVDGVSAALNRVTGGNHALYRPSRPGTLPPALIVAIGDRQSEFLRIILDELHGPGRYSPSDLTVALRGARYICASFENAVEITEVGDQVVAGEFQCAASPDRVRLVTVRGRFRLEQLARQPMATPEPAR